MLVKQMWVYAGLKLIYFWASASIFYVGVHTLGSGPPPDYFGPAGPPIHSTNWIGLEVTYTPRSNDWPNVNDPDYQYWPSKKN